MDAEQISEIANELGRAVESADIAALDRLYSDDAVVWHNINNKDQSRADNLKLLSGIPGVFDVFRYINIRRHIFDDGFVQQHDIDLRYKDGKQTLVHICMVVSVRDGKITRIDEYIDSAQADFADHPAFK